MIPKFVVVLVMFLAITMELYPEISRLALARDERTALRTYFTKNPTQKAEAIALLPTCEDDDAKIQYLRDLIKPEAGNAL